VLTCTVFSSTHGDPGLLRSTLAAGFGTVGLLLIGFLVGCHYSNSDERVVFRVHAASSLTEAFQELAQEFENTHPSIDVSMVFSGSQVLRIQIEQGVSSDVLATANPEHMEILVESGHVKKPLVFARNELVLIVPLDNPAGIVSFEDLPKVSSMVVGTDQVPVGSYTGMMLGKAGQKLGVDFEKQSRSRVVSRESNVRLVRAKVEMGEADAAVVYRSDALASDRVQSISIPHDINIQARYFIAELANTNNRQLVGDWIQFVLSAAGQEILARHGFVEG